MRDHAELHGEVLDAPERARRLGLAVDARTHLARRSGSSGAMAGGCHGGWDLVGIGFLFQGVTDPTAGIRSTRLDPVGEPVDPGHPDV